VKECASQVREGRRWRASYLTGGEKQPTSCLGDNERRYLLFLLLLLWLVACCVACVLLLLILVLLILPASHAGSLCLVLLLHSAHDLANAFLLFLFFMCVWLCPLSHPLYLTGYDYYYNVVIITSHGPGILGSMAMAEIYYDLI
jgi:hypothetical protein